MKRGLSSKGGGYSVYLSDGNVPFRRVSFRLFFLEHGIERKQFFWSQSCQNMSKGEISLD